jgi:hypothetical protein
LQLVKSARSKVFAKWAPRLFVKQAPRMTPLTPFFSQFRTVAKAQRCEIARFVKTKIVVTLSSHES